jgi:rhodanese-related sulfurtransferase
MEGLLDLLEERVNGAAFDTIVLVSDDGQDALFATTLLRILGYNNVFALRLGMGWHADYTDSVWNKHVSSDFVAQLSTDPPPTKSGNAFPVLMSEHSMAYDLIRERVAELLAEGYKHFRITAEDVFANPGKYYIINYWSEEEYLLGHIPGAYQYSPRKSLKRETSLSSIPFDKPVVIYCHQGNMSSSATAYLRLIGYDVLSLEFGTNSFMHSHHKEQGIKNLYNPEDAIDYPLEGSRSGGMPKGAPPVLVGVRGEGGC